MNSMLGPEAGHASFFLEVFFISVTHHIAHRDSLLADCRKTLWVVALENLYRVVVGGHAAYWQHLVCTLSSGQRQYLEVGHACCRDAPASRSAKRVWRSKVAAVRPAFHIAVSSSSSGPPPPPRNHCRRSAITALSVVLSPPAAAPALAVALSLPSAAVPPRAVALPLAAALAVVPAAVSLLPACLPLRAHLTRRPATAALSRSPLRLARLSVSHCPMLSKVRPGSNSGS